MRKNEIRLKRWKDGMVYVLGNGKVMYFSPNMIFQFREAFERFESDHDPCDECDDYYGTCLYAHPMDDMPAEKPCHAKQTWLNR